MNQEKRYCACGCGLELMGNDPTRIYRRGHSPKPQRKKCANEDCSNFADGRSKYCKECLKKMIPGPRLCACGCGGIVTSKLKEVKFLPGHGSTTEECKEKFKKTCLERYGSLNPIGNKEILQKSRRTCIERYGCDNVFKSNSIKNKIRKYYQDNYGVDNASQVEEIKQKAIDTTISRYGNSVALRCQQFKDKSKETCKNRYGVEFYSQTEEFKTKFKETMNEKYGVDSPTQFPEFIDKIRKTNIERYGVEWQSQSEETKEKVRNSCLERFGVDNFFKSEDFLKNNINYLYITKIKPKLLELENWQICFDDNEFFGWTKNSYKEMLKYPFKCKQCGNIHNLSYNVFNQYSCPTCYPNNGKSHQELEIRYFIESLINDDIIYNDRKLLENQKEIDIYIPSKNLAIEYDGLYWHSQHFHNNRKYHLEKTEKCNDKSIQLVHIFEDEWNFKKDIVKSRIKNLLGIHDKIVYARKCEVKLVKEYKFFLNENHIQGYCPSKYNYGLYYNNELICLMTFGEYRKALGRNNVENEYEMLRFCNKIGYHIPGAASKLLKHFVLDNNPNKIISYADRRWSKGKLYESLGFKFIRNTPVNYWYIYGNSRYHRFNFRKSILKNKLEIFDENKSEYENMINNGYDRIFDCGSILYEWNRT